MFKFIALFLGATRLITVRLVGQLPIAELANVVVLPWLLLRRWQVLRLRPIPLVLGLGAAYLGSQVLSDMVFNRTPQVDYLRGWANVGMILTSFMLFTLVFYEGVDKNYRWYLAGLVLSGIYFIRRGQYAGLEIESEFWNLKVQPWATPAMLLLLWWLYRRRPYTSGLVAVGYAMAAVVGGARAHGMQFFLLGVGIIIVTAGSRGAYQLTVAQVARYGAVGLLVATVGFGAFVNLGLRGLLGEKTQKQLVVLENPYNPVGLILIARMHTVAGMVAIADKPLFGHGSWARDPQGRYDRRVSEMLSSFTKEGAKVDYGQRVKEDDVRRVPSGHSHILAGWVYAGVFGGVFWIVQLVLITKLAIFFIKRSWCPFLPIAMFALVSAYWSILFSPLGWGRNQWPALMAGMIIYRMWVMQQEYAWAAQKQQQAQAAPATAVLGGGLSSAT